MTNNAGPLPKLRVTCLSWTVELPQWAHCASAEIDGDDNEPTRETDFDNGFCAATVEGKACDPVLGFARLGVTLPLDNLPCEDDAFEIKDGEAVIFKFFGCMG